GLIESFQKSWMYSTGHRQNLLKPEYTRFGYGIVVEQISGRAYAVQNFATEIPE
ncbi:MAG: CAP domain-containing protein, partial [Leptolyngbyaceae cyanobacterium CAN_BIN12]|nr:CAP domain-containing protein [Leptolyngbyaceae cyanobacterium CAN_BIN12]